CVAFSGDAAQVAVADRHGYVSLWSVASGRLLRRTERHSYPARGVQFVPERDDLLASCGDDDTIRFCHVDTGQNYYWINTHQGRVWSGQFSPNGRRPGTAGGGPRPTRRGSPKWRGPHAPPPPPHLGDTTPP